MSAKKSYATVTDQFCGAGGSSLGATKAGAEVVMALNHWKLAIETHQANFQNTDHDCTDIQACDPRRYPSTNLLITSPECTNHSLAKGQKRVFYDYDLFKKKLTDPAAERSRATMWDVPRFAEYHRYELIIVENVIDARGWALWPAWLQAMDLLGYAHQCVYLNSMFCHPTPQSRDRMYVVFWRQGNRKPDLEIRPVAPCLACGKDVEARQTWKYSKRLKRTHESGRYGKQGQYVYTCPECRETVHPYYYPAMGAIDWSLPIQRIGDRKKPLEEKTLARIELGLKRFGDQRLVMDILYSHAHGNRSHPVSGPWPTQTTQQSLALVSPFLGMLRTHSTPRAPYESLQTVVTDNQHFLVDPAMIVQLRNHQTAQGLDEPLSTITAGGRHHGVVTMPFLTRHYSQSGDASHLSRDVADPLGAITAADHHSLTIPEPFILANRSTRTLHSIDEPLGTQVAAGSQHAVIAPPGFLASYYGNDNGTGLGEPLGTIPTVDRHALVRMPFTASQYNGDGRNAVRPIVEALPTIPGMAVHYLAQPGELPKVEDCGFRMLEPAEIKAAMAFPDEYIVLGNKRQQVRQCGNAVTPPAMAMLIERCLATLR